jgi:hypothetical protein
LARSGELMSGRLPNAIDRHVASRLRLRRLEAGLTQTQLAQAVGVTYQQLQKYEGTINRISAGALYQLALTLDVPVQYFFDGLSRLFNRIMSRCHSDFCGCRKSWLGLIIRLNMPPTALQQHIVHIRQPIVRHDDAHLAYQARQS